MTKEKIQLLGVSSTPYDVLLDEYEVGMTVEDYDPLFAGLRERLVPLLQAITKAQDGTDEPTIPEGVVFSVEAQKAFCEAVSNHMGFDFEAGRMDASTIRFPPVCGRATRVSRHDLTRRTPSLASTPSCTKPVTPCTNRGLTTPIDSPLVEQPFHLACMNPRAGFGKIRSVERRRFGKSCSLGSVLRFPMHPSSTSIT